MENKVQNRKYDDRKDDHSDSFYNEDKSSENESFADEDLWDEYYENYSKYSSRVRKQEKISKKNKEDIRER